MLINVSILERLVSSRRGALREVSLYMHVKNTFLGYSEI